MAHPEQEIFCLEVKKRFPPWPLWSPFHRSDVLDCGSLDINGNNHFLFSRDCDYFGIDIAEGPNVHAVSKIHEWDVADGSYDTIICTECFEHDMYWPESIRNILRLLRPGGLLIFTCATGNRDEHGTRRTAPEASPLTAASNVEGWPDYYRNLFEADFRTVLDFDHWFNPRLFEIARDNRDLYFYGVKRAV